MYYAPQHPSVLESKKIPFEKVLFGLSVDYVCEAIFIKSTLVWWYYMCSESGDKCEVWADCSQVNGEFWTNWRIGGERRKVKEPTFSPPRNSKWVSPLFLWAATGWWLCSCFLEPPSLGRVTIFITHHWREEAWARPHCWKLNLNSTEKNSFIASFRQNH